MPLKSATISTWLSQIGWVNVDQSQDKEGVPFYPGPYIPKSPDRVVIVTAMPGVGFALEGNADWAAFQARIRGMQSPNEAQSYTDAESLAFQLDSLIFNAAFPVVVNGQTLVKVYRAGGQPAPLGAGPDDADRYEFTASYAALVGV